MGINIALDGPAGAGKTTLAKAVAEKLGYIYVDTGALYRAVAYYISGCGKDVSDPSQVIPLLPQINVEMKHADNSQKVFVNGEDVSDKIRTPDMSMKASTVSAIPEVREFLLGLQRSIAAENNVVMDGRDIGTVILPNADIKFFVTASVKVRAERRYKELLEKGQKDVKYDDVFRDLTTRDYNDSHRQTAPLKQADDAIIYDTSSFDLQTSIYGIVEKIRQKLNDNTK